MRRQRYLEKLEKFEEEYEFIESHEIKDDVTLTPIFAPGVRGRCHGHCGNANERPRHNGRGRLH